MKRTLSILGLAFVVWAVTSLSMMVALRTQPLHAQNTPTGGRYWTAGVDGVGATLTKLTLGADSSTPDPNTEAIYITDLYAQSTTTTGGQFILRHGTATELGGAANCASDTKTFFPTAATTTARVSNTGSGVPGPTIQFKTPIRVPAGRDICVLGVATNLVVLDLRGELRP